MATQIENREDVVSRNARESFNAYCDHVVNARLPGVIEYVIDDLAHLRLNHQEIAVVTATCNKMWHSKSRSKIAPVTVGHI
jgi:hypothetical protein